MSTVKVLSDKEQRKTLSNAKKKKKPVLKNVYMHPHDEYWPVLSADDEAIVTDLVKGLLPAARAHKISAQEPLKESKDSKRKRNSASSCQEECSVLSEKADIRSQMVVGLREVIAAIEGNQLRCLLLAKDVDPPFLRSILGNLAAAYDVPFVAITNFRVVLEQVLGFKSWCVGFKDLPNGYFKPICDKVLSLIKGSQNPKISAVPESTSEFLHSSSKSNKKQLPKSSSLANLHLYRTDKTKRVFVPCTSGGKKDTSSEFLAFSKDDGDNEMDLQNPQGLSHTRPSNSSGSSKISQPQRYFEKVKLQPLQVKKFQGNPNKLKWRKDFRNKPK